MRVRYESNPVQGATKRPSSADRTETADPILTAQTGDRLLLVALLVPPLLVGSFVALFRRRRPIVFTAGGHAAVRRQLVGALVVEAGS